MSDQRMMSRRALLGCSLLAPLGLLGCSNGGTKGSIDEGNQGDKVSQDGIPVKVEEIIRGIYDEPSIETDDAGKSYLLVKCSGDGIDEDWWLRLNSSGEVLKTLPRSYENGEGGYTLYEDNGQKNETHCHVDKSADVSSRVLHDFNGTYLVLEEHSGFDDVGGYFGLVNKEGEWLEGSPLSCGDILEGSAWGLEVGVLPTEQSNLTGIKLSNENGESIWLFLDVKSGELSASASLWSSGIYIVGNSIYCQMYDGRHAGDLCCLEGGTITSLATDAGVLLDSNEQGFLTDKDGLTFYSLGGEWLWTYSEREVGDAFIKDDCVIVQAKGANGSTWYLVRLGAGSGSPVADPINYYDGRVAGSVAYFDTAEGEIINYETGESVVQFEGKSSAKYLGVAAGMVCMKVDGEYVFYDGKGDLVDPKYVQ